MCGFLTQRVRLGTHTEAVVQRCSVKELFLNIAKFTEKNLCQAHF